MKSLTQLLVMAISPLLLIPVGTFLASPLIAQPLAKPLAASPSAPHNIASPENKFGSDRDAIALRPPDSPHRPGWGTPGGSRGAVLASGGALENASTDNELIAFIEDGQTLAAYPTLFIYVPEVVGQLIRQQNPLDISFALIDEQDRVLYESTRVAPEHPGILGIRLDEMEFSSPLEVDTQYRWVVAITPLNPALDLGSNELFGWIQRTSLGTNALDEITLSPATRHHFYAEEGIWYDAITALFELKRENPTVSTFDEEIQELLASVGL
ncbi:MAG: DUF928 domain-containing protein, partial [Symploca sp. SIO2B6]|nr:DUF928 domain-containing protein [Symploca sp. SIO2B6]